MKLLPKKLRDFRHRCFYNLLESRADGLKTLGDQSRGVQWTILPTLLNAKSIVYSGGVGDDISFEHALVKEVGCDIVLLDPSPVGMKTMALPENKLPHFRFLPLALADHSGRLKLAHHPDNAESWYTCDGDTAATFEIPCADLHSLMQQNGHTHIDLLKLDIEGSEYAVIDDFLRRRIPVRQVCADFDFGYTPGIRRSQAIRAILKLVTGGYKLVCHEHANHTFIRSQWPVR
jgi:FkbM family methyltransferase